VRLIYHIVCASDWNANDPAPYRAASLALEGFIHCSYAHQVARVANHYFAAATDLLVLAMDADQVYEMLRHEDNGLGECFPHIYGPVDRDAIASVRELHRDAQGMWLFDMDADS
jgi:uncharacterized protein (DUF952 family)